MADKHPYVTAPSYLVQVINQFRKSFPSTVTADTLKKFGIAPKNESYILNILRYLRLIDQDGNKTELASKTFSLHDDAAFSQELEKLVMTAYRDLFELRGPDAWKLDTDALITFFRSSDETTEHVGRLQASTFRLLAGFSGYGDIPEKTSPSKQPAATPKTKTVRPKRSPTIAEAKSTATNQEGADKKRDFGLTVRIEINLPAGGDEETYDRIFRSIRENLLDA